MAGLQVRLFLVDGAPQGMRTATVGNWNGVALVCPRHDLVKLGQRDEAHKAGVYLLLAPSDERTSRLRVYVGEADDFWARLQNHDSKKEFWTWVIAFVATDRSLNKAHVRWLEATLLSCIRESARADVENVNKPCIPLLHEADAADMEVFFGKVCLLLPLLGADVLDTTDVRPAARGLVLELKWDTAEAHCDVREGQFTVRKGSSAREKEVDSLADGYRALRKKLLEDDVLTSTGGGLLRFTKDYRFDSPSAAAAVVAGTNLNGRVVWKVNEQGISYKEWQEQQLGTANGSD